MAEPAVLTAVAALRALDASLSTCQPDPRLERRLRASLRARGRSRWFPPGGEAARIGWPLGLVAATAAAILVAGRPQPGGERAVAGGDPGAVAHEQSDAGPADPSLQRTLPPAIHAPGLREPASPARSALPVTPVPEGRRSPVERSRLLPAPPETPRLDDGPVPRPRPGAPRLAPASPALGSLDGSRGAGRGPLGSAGGFTGWAGAPGHAGGMVAGFSPTMPAYVPPAVATPPSAAVPPPQVRGNLGLCLDPGTLEKEGDARCQAQGMVASTYELFDPCGDGTYQRVDPKCVPPAGTSSSCTTGIVGDSVTCADAALLEKQAEEACLSAGLTLADVGADPAGCSAGQATYAKYACCASPAPAPPPVPGCFPMELDVATCATHDDLTSQALALCATKGGMVMDLAYAHECPGGALTASYTCCSP